MSSTLGQLAGGQDGFCMVPGLSSDRRLAERWAGHSPRAPQVLTEESIEPLASYIDWAGVQYEQQHGTTGGDVRDRGHDGRSPALYEIVEEGSISNTSPACALVAISSSILYPS